MINGEGMLLAFGYYENPIGRSSKFHLLNLFGGHDLLVHPSKTVILRQIRFH